jgi:hypothetical protein
MKKLQKRKGPSRKRASKEAQKKLQKQTELMMRHPTECCLCKTPFERTHETVKTWQVTVTEGRVRLTCSQCWDTIKEAVEQNTNECQ